jgi:hypothetical protein
LLSVLTAALLALAAPPQAPAPAPAPSSLTTAEQAELKHNIMLGDLLYRYDQSAWHVTDAALAALPDNAKNLIRGYVTTPTQNGLRTTFYGEGINGYQALYSAVWTGSAIEDAQLYSAGQRRTLSDQELQLVQARKIALEGAKDLAMCSTAPPNVIVFPDPDDVTIHVYVMTPETKDAVYPLGGHYRIDVRNGAMVGQRAFTQSCFDFDSSTVGEKGSPVAAFITHLLDPVPTEIHVFTVLAMHLPLYVGVRDGRVYVVEVSGGEPRVRLVSKSSAP